MYRQLQHHDFLLIRAVVCPPVGVLVAAATDALHAAAAVTAGAADAVLVPVGGAAAAAVAAVEDVERVPDVARARGLRGRGVGRGNSA